MHDLKQAMDEFDTLRRERSTWNNLFQVVGEYVSQFKQNFEVDPQPGEFLIDDVYDSTGVYAAQNASSALLGMLWPGSAKKAVEIIQPDDMQLTTELEQFYSKMTARTVAAMDDPRARLMLSLDEYMIDQMVFGTSGVGVVSGETSKLVYRPYSVKESYIEEGMNGAVSKVYLMYEWRAERVVAEYGIENVSERLRKSYKDGRTTEKVKVLHIIRPRTEAKAELGALAMPYESVHVEYETRHVLKESGFNEMPIAFGRFRKLSYERYGRAPAMSALPDIREANVLREAVIVATEKVLDPPLGILDDGMLGGSVIDTTSGAINVFNGGNNMSNRPPVFEISTVGDINVALARLQDLEGSISRHFFIDRLLDFNTQSEMTLGEVQIRDQIRTASLSALFSRQLTEVFLPLVERSVNILWRDGEFGVVPGTEEEQDILDQRLEPEYLPDEIVRRLERGEDVYTVGFKTKAASAQRSEEYLATIELLGQFRQDINIDPSIGARINLHKAYQSMAGIRGVPLGVVRQDDETQALIQQQQQAQQQAAALAAAQQVADISDTAASAAQKAGA